MSSRKKHETSHLSILEAVETLSCIADMDFEKEVKVATDREIEAQNQLVTAKTVKLLKHEDPDSTAKLIKDTFHVVLDYLRDFYKHEYRYVDKPRVMDGVKTIMVLVGEAAQKLDKYTTLFSRTKAKRVRSLKEYKKLQEFYLTRIAKKIEVGVLGKWILELTKSTMKRRKAAAKLKGKRPLGAEHVFIDLESVKKDTEYELFSLKKEDGSRFYNPRLTRNITLICDFEGTIGTTKKADPFSQIRTWQDHAMHIAAKCILNAQGEILDRYFHEVKSSGKRRFVSVVNKAVVALLMSSNPKNLLRNSPVKSCSEYFSDFQRFLRDALKSSEYQRYIVYPPKRSARLSNCLLEVVHGLSRALFSSVTGYQELVPVFEDVFLEAEENLSPEHVEAAKECQMFWSHLAAEYAAMKKLIKLHPNGPLMKDLEMLNRGTFHTFDPIAQFNIPFQLYALYLQERKITNIRIPSPTHQEFIHKAKIIDEFKGFLRSCLKPAYKRKYLIINFQDRTSWREHSRSAIIEGLQRKREFSKLLTVVTLAKDTEFYHQVASYQQDNHAKDFMAHFKEHLIDDNCGFHFPKAIKKEIFPKFIDVAMNAIHRIFFAEMNVLTVKNRLDFIEVFYLFLQLKLIELVQPDFFSLMCKDGIDIGGAASIQLYVFLKILNNENLTESEIEKMNLMLYTAPLLIRERLILPEPFDRMINAIKRIEGTKQELGNRHFKKVINEAFGKLYDTPILKSIVSVPILR